MSNLRRGDLIFVDNPIQKPCGRQMAGNHPAVVVSNDDNNYHMSTVVICWVTSNLKRTDLPTKVTFQQGQYGLNRDSVMEAEQMTTIDENDVEFLLGHLSNQDMERVDQALMVALGMAPFQREVV